jgi:outer membrane protein assembly factor BamD
MRVDRIARRAGALLLLSTTTLGCAGNHVPVDASPDELLGRAEEKLGKHKALDAVELLEYFLRTYPGTAQTPRAKLRLGDARFELEEYVLARGEYEDVVQDYPASPHVEEARYKIARCSYASIYPHYLDQTETERAIALLEEFRRDYPKSAFVPEANEAIADCRERLAHGDYEAGRFYEKQRRLLSAKIQFEYVVDRYPETVWACKARLELGRVHREKGKLEEARTWYQRVLDGCAQSEEAALARQELDEMRAEEGGAS